MASDTDAPGALTPAGLHRIVGSAIVAVVGGLILYFSLFGTPPIEPPAGTAAAGTWDKALHAVAYAGLTAALWYTTYDLPTHPLARAVTLVVAATGYGLAIEAIQWASLTRSADPWDALANLVGALIAFPLAYGLGGARAALQD